MNSGTSLIALSLTGLVGGLNAYSAQADSIECAKQSEILAEFARYNHMEGGIPKNEPEEVLPNGSIVTLIVDKQTKEWKILTVRPDAITCVLFEGMSWTGHD